MRSRRVARWLWINSRTHSGEGETGKDPIAHAAPRPSVLFSPDPIKTGYTKDGSVDIKATVTATVIPRTRRMTLRSR